MFLLSSGKYSGMHRYLAADFSTASVKIPSARDWSPKDADRFYKRRMRRMEQSKQDSEQKIHPVQCSATFLRLKLGIGQLTPIAGSS